MVSSDSTRRTEKLRKMVIDGGLEGVVLAPGPNLRYYTGVNSQMFERPFLFFLPAVGEAQLVAPKIEVGPYTRSRLKIEIHEWDDTSGPSGAFAALRRRIDLKGKWGCEGRVPFGYLTQFMNDDLELASAELVLQAIRAVKEPSELLNLRKAATILSDAYAKVPSMLREGITELELSTALREEVLSLGGDAVDFCMVQAGAHAADSHLASSSKRIERGEGVIIDAGCTIEGYNADITRRPRRGPSRRRPRGSRLERWTRQREATLRAEGSGGTSSTGPDTVSGWRSTRNPTSFQGGRRGSSRGWSSPSSRACT
jgi:Xaa-Pro aminopeptidase